MFMESGGIQAKSEIAGNTVILQSDDMKALQGEVIAILYQTDLCPVKMEIAESSLENLFFEVVS